MRNKQFDKANEVIEESFARGNRSLDSLKLFAQVKLALKDWGAAEKIANMLQEIEGQEALSQQVLGVVYLGQEQREEGIKAFKRAHDLAPSASQPVVALVRTYVQSGKTDEAKRFLESILSVDADNLIAYTLLGQLSLFENQPDQAEKYFLKTVEINPKQTVGYRSLARIYVLDNKPEKAAKIIKDGLVALPTDPALTMSLASVYERQRDFDSAIDIYEKLLESNPDNLIAKNNLASLLTDHRGDSASLDRARSIAAEFRDSKIPHFRDTYAWAQVVSDQQLEQAVSILEGIVKEVERTAIFHYHLGKAYAKKSDPVKAAEQLELAIKYSGSDTDLLSKANQELQQMAQ